VWDLSVGAPAALASWCAIRASIRALEWQLADADRPVLRNLRAHERSVHSQAGEDGVLLRIFECIGTSNRYFVEFGAKDGCVGSNTAHLRIDHGWTGLLMEGDAERAREPVRSEFVTAENVNALFAKHRVPVEFDLLSIDVDGNDYWIWKAIDGYRPRLVVIEYNIFFGPSVRKTIPYSAEFCWDKTPYHGASLAALQKLGREKDYTLVHADSYAPNAFFLRNSELPETFVERAIEEISDWWLCEEPEDELNRPWVSV
jgi:hypothetical protein